MLYSGFSNKLCWKKHGLLAYTNNSCWKFIGYSHIPTKFVEKFAAVPVYQHNLS